MTTVTVYPTGVSGLTPARAKQIKAQRRPEPQSGIVVRQHICPTCEVTLISARYARAGYQCDSCAENAENGHARSI